MRLPTLMSAVTGIPGAIRKPSGTSCSLTWSIAMRVLKNGSVLPCGTGTAPIPVRVRASSAPVKLSGADRAHRARGHAVLVVGEGIELDRHRVPDMHEAVVAPGDVALHLERHIGRDEGDELIPGL